MPDEASHLAVEFILREWLDDPEVLVFCGDWNDGAVMELLPRGGAQLSGQRYEPPFQGLRDLRLSSGPHHVHLDLGRLTRVCYRIAPSVCYGYRPSFEVRFTTAAAEPRPKAGLGMALSHPYSNGRLKSAAIRRYLQRARDHSAAFPGVVAFHCQQDAATASRYDDWNIVDALVSDVCRSMPEFHGASAKDWRSTSAACEPAAT